MTVRQPLHGLRVSVVSHGHAALAQELLLQMARECAGSVTRVVLTQNLPETEPRAPEGGWPFALDVVRNTTPRGFGANHNHALAGAEEPFVCVINPDVALLEGPDPLAALRDVAAEPGVGCAYPVQLDAQGRVEASERELPTPLALWRRRVLGRPQRRVDWVNGACMVLPAAVWARLDGFDEGYFMYCEDVDLCLRLRALGLRLERAPVRVVHAGQRASHHDSRHLAWHARSLLRLWFSAPYRAARRTAASTDAAAPAR